MSLHAVFRASRFDLFNGFGKRMSKRSDDNIARIGFDVIVSVFAKNLSAIAFIIQNITAFLAGCFRRRNFVVSMIVRSRRTAFVSGSVSASV